jgi:hypothetical protein
VRAVVLLSPFADRDATPRLVSLAQTIVVPLSTNRVKTTSS